MTANSWTKVILILFANFNSLAAVAQETVHRNIRKGLVAITVTAKDSKGNPVVAFGTGFITHPLGYVLTTYHLIGDLPDAISATVKYSGKIGDLTSNDISMTRLTDDRDLDILVLKLKDRADGYDSLSFEDIQRTKNVEIYTSGFAETCVAAPTDTASSCNNRNAYYTTGGPGHITTLDAPLAYIWGTDLTINRGNSGSPVYLRSGQVVGIAKGKLTDADNSYYFIPINFAKTALDKLNVPILVSKNVENCAAEEAARQSVEGFVTPTGGARAPSNGARFGAVTTKAEVCYQAPPGWRINGPVNIADGGNNGGRGWIGPAKYAADMSSVCVPTAAWSDSTPFGAGGWQYVTLSGAVEKTLTADERAAIERTCGSK